MRRRSKRLLESIIFAAAACDGRRVFIGGAHKSRVSKDRRRPAPGKSRYFRRKFACSAAECSRCWINKNGHHVLDLPQKAFQVFENGVAQTIRLFQARRRAGFARSGDR